MSVCVYVCLCDMEGFANQRNEFIVSMCTNTSKGSYYVNILPKSVSKYITSNPVVYSDHTSSCLVVYMLVSEVEPPHTHYR